jgi:hypothetical protein
VTQISDFLGVHNVLDIQEKKFKMLKCGHLGGYAIGPFLLIHLFGNFAFKTVRTLRITEVWVVLLAWCKLDDWGNTMFPHVLLHVIPFSQYYYLKSCHSVMKTLCVSFNLQCNTPHSLTMPM